MGSTRMGMAGPGDHNPNLNLVYTSMGSSPSNLATGDRGGGGHGYAVDAVE